MRADGWLQALAPEVHASRPSLGGGGVSGTQIAEVMGVRPGTQEAAQAAVWRAAILPAATTAEPGTPVVVRPPAGATTLAGWGGPQVVPLNLREPDHVGQVKYLLDRSVPDVTAFMIPLQSPVADSTVALVAALYVARERGINDLTILPISDDPSALSRITEKVEELRANPFPQGPVSSPLPAESPAPEPVVAPPPTFAAPDPPRRPAPRRVHAAVV